MDFSGNILKMRSELLTDNGSHLVEYHMSVGSNEIEMNKLIANKIRLEYTGKINCIYCGRLSNKSFAQGYCYPCFISLPQTEACMLHPEKCEAHLGISRDMSWSENNCLREHVVYLALTPGLKVGVTKVSQIPGRWIDQGAWQAIVLARTPNRFLAGKIEVFLKSHISDKTNWRKMLSGERYDEIDLVEKKKNVSLLLSDQMSEFLEEDNSIVDISYPVDIYPQKVKSLSLDKTPVIEGVLSGIKGQYLIFTSGEVVNIRKHGGYHVELRY